MVDRVRRSLRVTYERDILDDFADRKRAPAYREVVVQMGMMVEGFTRRPMFMSPWNPPYLPVHVETAGYVKEVYTFDYDFDLGSVRVRHAVASPLKPYSARRGRPATRRAAS